MESRKVWRVLTPVALFGAGLLLATTATTADGTDLRAGRRTELASLINAKERDVEVTEQQRSRREERLADLTRHQAGVDGRIAAPQQRIDTLRQPAGLGAVGGPAITVILNDAPHSDGLPAGATPDDLVVHQQDVQAVVNALWVGGAEAMTIMDQRVIATTAVRCVGNTLLLDGRTYSPPFRITAIGDYAAMSNALAESSGVRAFQRAAQNYGLGYRVTAEAEEVTLPAYRGSTALPNSKTSP